MGWLIRWLPRFAVITAGALGTTAVTLLCVQLVDWNQNAAQPCLLCAADDSVQSWLCYFAVAVGGAGLVVAVFLLVLPIWPQVQSVVAWLLAGLFAALGGLMTKYSLPVWEDGTGGDAASILAVFALAWASVLVWAGLAVERCCAPQTDGRLGRRTRMGLHSSKSFDLESGLDAAKRTPRGEAWWSVALKAPLEHRLGFTGSEVQYRDADSDPGTTGWTTVHGFGIDAWLRGHLSRDARGALDWSGFVLYSDEPPAAAGQAGQPVDPARHGACKGVLLWNKTHVGWLVHTVPHWPSPEGFLEEGYIPPLPLEHETATLAQSFVFMTLPLSKLREVHSQLNLMQAHVYASRQDGIYAFMLGPPPAAMLNRLVLGGGLYHVAKRGEWKGDIYGDGLAEKEVFGLCGGPVHVQSWREGEDALAANIDADNVEQTRWANGAAVPASLDHGCWAVSSASAKHRWSFVGDLSRVESHLLRGGGGVVIRDPALWRTLLDSIEEWDGPFGK